MAEEEATFAEDTGVSDRLRQDRPHSARMYDYFLGGKTNYAVDRSAAEDAIRRLPTLRTTARVNRAFVHRSARFLARECGVRQFLDIGTGLPNVDNTHEIAQRVAPECRIVYVDNDPLVLAHARALLTSTPEGVTNYVDADLRDPDAIVREAKRTLDFDQPIGLMLMGILGHIEDFDEARSIVRRLVAALPSGSYLVQYDSTDTSEAYVDAIRQYNEGGSLPYILRSPEQIARFFDGLELLEPGVASCSRWRPDAEAWDLPEQVHQYGGVALKR